MVFVRTEPFPCCKHCGKQMSYYVPFMRDEDHAHPECEGKALGEAMAARFKASLENAFKDIGTEEK